MSGRAPAHEARRWATFLDRAPPLRQEPEVATTASPTALPSGGTAAGHAHEVQTELLADLYRRAHSGAVASPIAGLAYALGTWSSARAVALEVWLGLQGLALVLGLSTFLLHARDGFPSLRAALLARRAGSTFNALVWAAGYWMFCSDALDVPTATYLMCLVGLLAGVTSYFVDPPSVMLYAFTVSTPVVLGTWAQAPWLSIPVLLLLSAMMRMVFSGRRAVVDALTLRFRNQALFEAAREQQRAAEHAAASKTRFLAAASHELRQPAQAIALFAHSLQQPTTNAASRARTIGRLSDASQALGTTMERLLDLSRVDADVHAERPLALDSRALLLEVAESLHDDVACRHVALDVRGRQHWAWADPTNLRRVVHNLASNAIRHGRPGGTVLLCARRRGPQVELQVWDDGPGISEEDRERIFEEFVQLDNPERDRNKGLGLGLALVRRLCSAAGWQLSLRSETGHGSVFCVRVPMADPITNSHAPEQEPCERTVTHAFVVEDDSLVRGAMCQVMRERGFVVRAFSHAEPALAALRNRENLPGVLITDWRLPGSVQGEELLRRAQALAPGLHMLMVTGESRSNRPVVPREVRVLHKPVDGADLLRALASIRIEGKPPQTLRTERLPQNGPPVHDPTGQPFASGPK